MSKKWLKVALMVTAIATSTSIQVDAETVLFVPQDDRPVSLQYTVDTAKAAGMTVLTPPQNLISGKTYKGQADQIWNWVEQKCGACRCYGIEYGYIDLWWSCRFS